MMRTYTAVFEQHGGWWIGYVEELPGANPQERTLEDARRSLTEIIPMILEARRESLRECLIGQQQLREELTIGM